jgi:hypothetical protein
MGNFLTKQRADDSGQLIVSNWLALLADESWQLTLRVVQVFIYEWSPAQRPTLQSSSGVLQLPSSLMLGLAEDAQNALARVVSTSWACTVVAPATGCVVAGAAGEFADQLFKADVTFHQRGFANCRPLRGAGVRGRQIR